MEGVTTFSCLMFVLGVSSVIVNANDDSSRRLTVVFAPAVVVEFVRDEDVVEAFSSPSGSMVGAELLTLLAVVVMFILWLMASIMLLIFDVSFSIVEAGNCDSLLASLYRRINVERSNGSGVARMSLREAAKKFMTISSSGLLFMPSCALNAIAAFRMSLHTDS